MTRYWKISPENWGEDPVRWERQWKSCLQGEKIAMGWNAVGDLSALTLGQIRNRLAKNGWHKRNAKQLWRFRNIERGDIIIANKGQKEIAGIGRVIGKKQKPYYYDLRPRDFKHTLPVEWLDSKRRKIKKQMNWLQTIIPLTKEEAQELGVTDIAEEAKRVQEYENDIRKGAKFSQGVVKTRTFQQAFRNVILDNYQRRCAVCDVDDDVFLRGCHIVPVKHDPSIAAKAQNGICLCVLHDVAFENGIFSISDTYRISTADSFKSTSGVLDSLISDFDGKNIRLPVRHIPNKSYLKRHRDIHSV